MIKKRTFLLPVAAIIFFAIGYFGISQNPAKQDNEMISYKQGSANVPKLKDADSRESEAETIQQMLRWQFMRLRDPKTNSIPVNIRNRELKFASGLPKDRSGVLRKGSTVLTSSNWVWKGPYNQGGRTKGIGVDVANDNIILAGAAEGGIWRSTDKGQSWTATTDPSYVQNVDCLVQDTRSGKTNTWYYGTGELQDNFYPGGNGLGSLLGNGIYKSTDDGVSWQPLQSTLSNSPNNTVSPFQIVWDIVIDPSTTSQDILYAACLGGIYRSTDGGGSWNAVLGASDVNTLYANQTTDVAIAKDGTVYAAISGDPALAGVYRSTDGTTWTKISPSFFPANVVRMVIAVPPTDNNLLYVFANTPGVGQAGPPKDDNDYNSLWRYDASQNQWTDLSDKLPAFNGNAGISTQGGYDMMIKVKPDDANFIVLGATNIYRTTDAFATQLTDKDWIGGYSHNNDNSSYANHHPDQHACYFLPSDPKVFYSAMDGGVSVTQDVTADSVVYESLNNGYGTAQFYNVAVDQLASDPVIVGGMQDNGSMVDTTTLPKSSWLVVNSGDGGYAAVADSLKYFYTSSQNGSVLRQKSDEWTTVTPAGGTNFLFITPYLLDPNNTDVMYLAAGARIWRNSDLAGIPAYSNDNTDVNWTTLNDSVDNQISALAMCKAVPNLLYFGTSGGRLYKDANANVMSSTVTEITGTNFPQGAYITSIAVDPNDSNKLLVSFSNYNVISIFYSEDGGQSWTAVAGNLEQNPDGSGDGPSIRSVRILSVNGTNVYFAGTTVGLFSTTNLNGMNTVWTQEAPAQIGNVVVECVTVKQSNGLVLAGTFGKGVYASSYTVTGVKENPEMPQSYALAQNYPNPFNPSTVIDYNLPQAGNVSLKVFDSAGRLVATLVDSYQQSGEHKINFDAVNGRLASGIYFYNLRSGNFNQTKKMVLLK